MLFALKTKYCSGHSDQFDPLPKINCELFSENIGLLMAICVSRVADINCNCCIIIACKNILLKLFPLDNIQ